ncbi:hypothetical protein [Nocardia sp. NBC_00416]|uniref:hypothetical protein n=1 Tax=Nocardia sp. NBC_00416 TaxID=2975991 RepID=UPI002E2084B4
MDAENASLGDERRGRPEEYGRAQVNSESRGFAGFGSNGFEAANGSNGATHRSDSIPDHGYTWTPAPPSTPTQNQHSTGGSAAMDPFAAWNTSGVIGDAAVQVMTSDSQDPDSRFSTSPSDPSPFPAPPDDPNGLDTAALSTRHGSPSGAHGQADSAAMPRISQPGAAHSAEPLPATDPTVPSGGHGLPAPDSLSGVATTQLPAAGTPEAAAYGYPPAPETGSSPSYHAAAPEADSFNGSSPDTGSLPSWLSSIGEEPVPQQLETGGRRRKLDLTESAEPAEAFNPFEDQHTPGYEQSSASETTDSHELPRIPSGHAADSFEADPAPRPELPSRGLPTRSPRARGTSAPGTEDEPAAAPGTARRLPRSAARHAPAPADEPDPGPATAHDPLTRSAPVEPEPAYPIETAAGPDGSEGDHELAAPRRLPRSVARYTTDDETSGSGGRSHEAASLRIVGPLDEAAPAVDAETLAPPRLAPPADSTPILDRLLDPEPAHGIDPGDESGTAPVAEILTRILESEQESGPSRHAGSEEPADPAEPEAAVESPATYRPAEVAPLALVPDETTEIASDEHEGDSRPPLETRRSRRAREAAEAAQTPLPDRPEPELPEAAATTAAPAELTGARPPAPAPDTASRHSRTEEGADIDIHLIMRLLTASDDLEVLAGQAEAGEVSAAEVARAARDARAAVLSAVSAWYGGPAQMVKFANALLQAARES